MKQLAVALLAGIIIFWGCKKDKSYEGGLVYSGCQNEYTGGCRLTGIVYEPTNVTDPQRVVNFTYSGNLITEATDAEDMRKFYYDSNNNLVKIEYYDNTSPLLPLYAIEYINYNSNNQVTQLIHTNVTSQGPPPVVDSSFKAEYTYNYNSSVLLKKVFSDYISNAWVSTATYDYQFNSDQLPTLVNYTDQSVTPNTVLPIPFSFSDTCNGFQTVYKNIELIDYTGMEQYNGLSVFFTARKLPSSLQIQPVKFVLNDRNAPVELYVGGRLVATYIYDCP
jgi:hypothetical protein